jgi:tRNA(fMet)-specific endonuclease VapC
MLYLLDTNTCIFILNKTSPRALERMSTLPRNSIVISSVTVYELDRGARKSFHVAENLAQLELLKTRLQSLSFDDAAAHAAGQVFDSLRRLGTPIGSNDTLIAGHALALNATLVTNNTKEFTRVPGLQLEDWLS